MVDGTPSMAFSPPLSDHRTVCSRMKRRSFFGRKSVEENGEGNMKAKHVPTLPSCELDTVQLGSGWWATAIFMDESWWMPSVLLSSTSLDQEEWRGREANPSECLHWTAATSHNGDNFWCPVFPPRLPDVTIPWREVQSVMAYLVLLSRKKFGGFPFGGPSLDMVSLQCAWVNLNAPNVHFNLDMMYS